MKKQLNKEAAVKESNKSENYLDKIPVRNGDFGWVENNGLVTVEQENKGTYDRLAQKLFKTPKVSHEWLHSRILEAYP